MTGKFSGSVVLEKDFEGMSITYYFDVSLPSACKTTDHVLIALHLAAASKCTAENVRRYFHTEMLPDPGTRCAPDETPFGV
jgi:hypothetical protein